MSDLVAIRNLTMCALSQNIEAADVWGLLTISHSPRGAAQSYAA